MSAQTKKEKIYRLFKLMEFEKIFKREEELIREETLLAVPHSSDQETIIEMLDEFTQKSIEIIKSNFEKIIDERFSEAEVEKLVATWSDPLFKQLEEAEMEILKKTETEIGKLLSDFQMKLMFSDHTIVEVDLHDEDEKEI